LGKWQVPQRASFEMIWPFLNKVSFLGPDEDHNPETAALKDAQFQGLQ
jgi:hypothetical protein